MRKKENHESVLYNNVDDDFLDEPEIIFDFRSDDEIEADAVQDAMKEQHALERDLEEDIKYEESRRRDGLSEIDDIKLILQLSLSIQGIKVNPKNDGEWVYLRRKYELEKDKDEEINNYLLFILRDYKLVTAHSEKNITDFVYSNGDKIKHLKAFTSNEGKLKYWVFDK